MPQNLKGYQAILAESERVGWPGSYIKDLYVIDFGWLMKEDAPKVFGWQLRNTGTTIFLEVSPHCLDVAQACKNMNNYPHALYYFFDGERLHEVTIDQLIDWQKTGAITLLPEKKGVTDDECSALIKKIREMQREHKNQMDEEYGSSHEYHNGVRSGLGAGAV